MLQPVYTTLYVWIKLVDEAESSRQKPSSGNSDQAKTGVRPQWVDRDDAPLAINSSSAITIQWQDRYEQKADAAGNSFWVLDSDYDGVQSSGLETVIAPMHGSHSECIDWLKSKAGAAWVADAKSYFLFSLKIRKSTELTRDQPAPKADSTPAANNAACTFPPSAWDEAYKNMDQPLHSFVPPTWQDRLALPPIPTDCTAECEVLKQLEVARTPVRQKEIEREARSMSNAIWPVVKILGDPKMPPRPNTVELVSLLLECIRAPLFSLKKTVNRGRPAHCCEAQQLSPLLPFPGHPAYPSGHAAASFAVACVLSEIRPELRPDFEAAARRVAVNREIAGVHYPSDSAAGQALAAHLVKLLLGNNGFKTALKAAQVEWPRPNA
jgi:hypothetical protein